MVGYEWAASSVIASGRIKHDFILFLSWEDVLEPDTVCSVPRRVCTYIIHFVIVDLSTSTFLLGLSDKSTLGMDWKTVLTRVLFGTKTLLQHWSLYMCVF